MERTHTTAPSETAADSALPDEHPRRRFGRRAQAGVPHTGWQWVSTDDLGEPLQVCEMCESQQIRYVFHMSHPDYPDILEVGSECAAMMGPEGGEARRRVREMKSRDRRRSKWLDGWRVSAAGNNWRKVRGYRITILPKASGWTFIVVRMEDEAQYFAPAPFSTSDEAKLAAFDFMWPACVQVS